ncbi:fmr1 neighbor protein isoform 2 [Mus musculus]|uniref:Isoform 2 of Fmr1 neighbor protein n=1 Tax=Mus musculus TaxID=10090 RepID=Q80ZA7-2|nr:fmr1 neighbor protein isoform 2 [Mus musculus]AAH99411.1 Fmr1nb protein [Mus musculus]AAI38088.1 Fmr1nb protein [Mus musculus]AAI71923.1 Fmr1nb protein [Mus musculus]|eukprot:NP_001160091.1 fragile X mental retardation 1 neighbor protein isoform 2 [Mus musculus]
MPSDRRPSQRRNRSKSRDYRGARSKVTRADTRNRDDTLALSMYQGPPSADQGNNMADAPRFGFWTSVSQCLQYLWARRHLGLLLLLFWTLVILFRPVNTAKLPILAEAAELEPPLGNMLDFFFPTKPTQVLRVFGLAAISILVLGFLPMCCCSMCWRRKRMNRMLKVLKKQKSKGKKPKGRKASEERALLSH